MTINSKTNAIQMVDKAIGDISGQQLVSSSQMTDLLLDIRLYLLLAQEATPTYEG
jgi:hypothetical protein